MVKKKEMSRLPENLEDLTVEDIESFTMDDLAGLLLDADLDLNTGKKDFYDHHHYFVCMKGGHMAHVAISSKSFWIQNILTAEECRNPEAHAEQVNKYIEYIQTYKGLVDIDLDISTTFEDTYKKMCNTLNVNPAESTEGISRDVVNAIDSIFRRR